MESKSRKRKRRWLRISLRTLLVTMLLMGTALGWIGAKQAQSRRQRDAVLALVELEGRSDEGLRSTDYWLNETWIRLPSVPSGDPFAENKPEPIDWSDFARHVTIKYDSGPYGSRRSKKHSLPAWLLAWTKEEWLHQVVAVDLAFTNATDAELASIRVLSDVERLNLDGTRVTDAILDHLSPLQELRHLCLGETKITDKGARRLHHLERLETLELWHNDITDEGIVSLESLENLKLLNLCFTNVTDDGVRRLQAALPDCRIFWDGNETFRLINNSPRIDMRGQNNPGALVRVVNHLFSMGRERALEALRQYVIVGPNIAQAPSLPNAGIYNQHRVDLILRVLFEPTEWAQEINGLPVCRLVGDIPFFSGRIVTTQSSPSLPSRACLVEWVAEYGRFRSEPLRPVDKLFPAADAACTAILSESPSLVRKRAILRQQFREQAEAMVAHLDFENPEEAKLRWSDERQEYVLAK